MQNVIDSLLQRPLVTVGVGSFLASVALFYILMQRTRKHRIDEARRNDT